MPKPDIATIRTHNGRPIVGDKIEIRQTGGAFSADLFVANAEQLLDVVQGDELTLAVRVVCVDDSFPVEDRKEPADGGVVRKVIFDPREVTIIDPQLVEETFAAQRERVARAKDAAEGQGRLPTDEELHSAHVAGEHSAGLVEGCVDCEHEADLEERGE